VVNLSVMRLDRKLAFDVNTKGVYNAILAAVAAKHDHFINTGPHFTVVGTLYDDYDFGISEDVPPHPGINLYSITKALGQEICKIVSENEPITSSQTCIGTLASQQLQKFLRLAWNPLR